LGAGAWLEAADMTLEAREEGAAEVALLPAADLTLSRALFCCNVKKKPLERYGRVVVAYLDTVLGLLLCGYHSKNAILVILVLVDFSLCLAVGGSTLGSRCIFELPGDGGQESSASAADLDRGPAEEEPVETEEWALTNVISDPLEDAFAINAIPV
jgi:hypothetical protein